MIDYYTCIKLKYPEITDYDFSLIDDGVNIYIDSWNDNFGTKPELHELEIFQLQAFKNIKKEEIKLFVHDEIGHSSIGYLTTGLTENFRVDAGRGDLDNLRNLKQYCLATNTEVTFVKDFYNNMHQITINELDIIILELIAYGLWLYQRKWEVDILIDNASSEEEVNSIVFFS